LAVPLHTVIETTLLGLGYELVDVEFGGSGLLRIFIDYADWQDHPADYIKIEDCEKATRQLNHVLTVEEIDYARLEVSSPGMDRPLNRHVDFVRFAGMEVSVKLKKLFEKRKHFQGVLSVEGDNSYSVMFDAVVKDAKISKLDRVKGVKTVQPKPASAKKSEPAPQLKLTFTLEEADRVRLVPQFNFKQAAE
jgi:ribosome maturation factor RimP